MWKDVEKEPNPNTEAWNDQVIRMKMFDNLICNRDRNMGNLLVDASWNLYLIDHNRAFITSKDLPVRMSRVRTRREEGPRFSIGPVGKDVLQQVEIASRG